MNKYQKDILEKFGKGRVAVFSCCCPIEHEGVNQTTAYGIFDGDNDTFTIQQDEDIKKTQYVLIIDVSNINPLEHVFVYKNKEWIEVPCVNGQYRFIADFDERVDATKLKFVKNIAEDLEIRIAYKEADKQAYAERQEALRKNDILKRAAIKHSVGESLVNIYFQPCADNYDHTEISLFIPDKTEVKKVGGPYGPINREDVLSWCLIMKTTIENKIFFKSITGLAYGRYAYIVKQFDKANSILIETDYTEFYIQRQQPPIIDQGNVVVI